MMRAVCMLSKDWLQTTPSRALRLLDETEWDFDVMLDYLSYDSFITNWHHTSRENKIKFIQIAKTLRRQQQRSVEDVNEEAEAVFTEAQEIAYRHHGDPSRPPEDDLEAKVDTAARQNVNEQRRVAATFGKQERNA